VDLYRKTRRNFANLESQGISFDYRYASNEGDQALQIELVTTLRDIAHNHGIKLFVCAEDTIQSLVPGVKKAHCVDPDLVEEVAKAGGMSMRSVATRTECGCIDSRDIGHYDSCPHGCIYCYANMNPDTALKNARQYAKEGFPLDNLEQPVEATQSTQIHLDL
jgi:hypothetical protein